MISEESSVKTICQNFIYFMSEACSNKIIPFHYLKTTTVVLTFKAILVISQQFIIISSFMGLKLFWHFLHCWFIFDLFLSSSHHYVLHSEEVRMKWLCHHITRCNLLSLYIVKSSISEQVIWGMDFLHMSFLFHFPLLLPFIEQSSMEKMKKALKDTHIGDRLIVTSVLLCLLLVNKRGCEPLNTP